MDSFTKQHLVYKDPLDYSPKRDFLFINKCIWDENYKLSL